MKKASAIPLILILVLTTSLVGYLYFYLPSGSCVQVVVIATHRLTGKTEVFGSPCAVPFWYKDVRGHNPDESPLKEIAPFASSTIEQSLIEKTTSSTSSNVAIHSDPTLDERIEQLRKEITQARGTGCSVVYSDGVQNVVCTDTEAETKFYLNQCLARDVEHYKERVLEERYILYQNNLPVNPQNETAAKTNEWELVKDCVMHEAKYWDGLYNKRTKAIYYVGETVPEFYTRILGYIRESNNATYPLFFISTVSERGGGWTYIADITILKTASFGNFAKVTKFSERGEFKWIGTILYLDKGIIVATEKGVAQYDYGNDTFDLIIPTKDYELSMGWGGGDGPENSDSLKYVNPNTFSYQLYDDEGVPRGGRITFTLK